VPKSRHPFGTPVADKVTLPEKPFDGVMALYWSQRCHPCTIVTWRGMRRG